MKIGFSGVLLGYSVIMTTVLAAILASNAIGSQSKQSFDEIDVKRINVREDDGTLRLVMSSKSRFPGLILHGKEHPHPNRQTAGLLFFNEEGTENGGLVFDGKRENGKASSSGHLSFDQYDQDQVVQITHSQHDGQRWAGIIVSDRPDEPTDPQAFQKAMAMPQGPERNAELQRLNERYGGEQRLFVGKDRDRSSAITLSDAAGRARIVLQVTADGAASIVFNDENGKAVRTLTASDGKP